jgi:hypothetical protein
MVQPVPLSIPVGIVVSWEFYPAWGKWFVRVESGEVDAEGEREYALMHPGELELVPDYEQGQRDMLYKCIAAVEALDVCWYVDECCQSPNHGILNDVYLALRALAENA